jgi:hypothetical protein
MRWRNFWPLERMFHRPAIKASSGAFGWLALLIVSSYIGGLGCDPYTSSGKRTGLNGPTTSGFVAVSPLARLSGAA